MKLSAVICVTIAAAVTILGSASARAVSKPLTYSGESRGVALILVVSPVGGDATLTIRFSSAGRAIRKRALHVRALDAFCSWPLKNGGGMSTAGVHLEPRQRTAKVAVAASSSRGGYTCGLHVHSETTQGWPSSCYIRHAILAVRLTRLQ